MHGTCRKVDRTLAKFQPGGHQSDAATTTAPRSEPATISAATRRPSATKRSTSESRSAPSAQSTTTGAARFRFTTVANATRPTILAEPMGRVEFDKILNMLDRAPRSRSRTRRLTPGVPAFTAALVAGDAKTAGDIASSYLADAGSRLAVVSDLLHPAQYQIGELWYEGRLGVAEEHRATAIVSTIASALPPTPAARPVRRGARCILSGIAGERHVVGLQLLTLALQDEGWLVDQLQPPTPLPEILRAVSTWRPDVVGLSAAYLPTIRQMTTAVAELRKLHVPVIVGGPLFNRAPGLWRTVGANAHGSDARVSTVLMRKYLR